MSHRLDTAILTLQQWFCVLAHTMAVSMCLFHSVGYADEETAGKNMFTVPMDAGFQMDFLTSDGSFIGTYNVGGKDVYCIRIKGPNNPDTESPVFILHSESPGVDQSFKKMSLDDVNEFIGARLSGVGDISQEESSFLAVLLVHKSRVAKIKNWGFGVAKIMNGKWTEVFREPKRGLVFPDDK